MERQVTAHPVRSILGWQHPSYSALINGCSGNSCIGRSSAHVGGEDRRVLCTGIPSTKILLTTHAGHANARIWLSYM